MLKFFRKRRAQRAIDSFFEKVMAEGLPSGFNGDASAGYLTSLAISKILYIRLFFGEHRFFRSSRAGRGDFDKPLFAAFVALMFSSLAPLLRIDEEQIIEVTGWQIAATPESWHEYLVGLTEALNTNAFDFSFKSNSILDFMRKVSNESQTPADGAGFLDEMLFNTIFLANTAEAQKKFRANQICT